MADLNKVIIKVYGKEYSIASSEDPGVTVEYAEYIDAVMREIAKKTSATDQDRVATLALLQITHELFQIKNRSISDSEEYDRRMGALLGEIEAAIKER